MSGQRRFKRSLSIRTSRLPSEVIYDRQLESIYDPKKGYTVYSIAKSGLENLTKSLAKDLGPDIRVNAVAPGAIIWPEIDSQYGRHSQEFDKKYRDEVINQSILKRLGEPADIAKAVEFLLLNAPFVTGETINIDGGIH